MTNMTSRLGTLGLATLGATAILVAGLVAPRSAAALRPTCSTARAVASSYIAAGNVAYGLGDYQSASYWYGRAEGLLEASCN